MVGDIHDRHDFGNVLPQYRLDPLPNSDLGETAALTAALEADAHPPCGYVDQGRPTTVSSDRGVHLLVEDPADALGELVGFGGLRRLIAPGDPLASRVTTPSSCLPVAVRSIVTPNS